MKQDNLAVTEPRKTRSRNSSQNRPAEGRNAAVADRFVIRLPNGLRDQIRALSEQNHRSMNAEIIMVLEQHIRQKFLQQMQDANASDVPEMPAASQAGVEDELSRRLEALPPGKKEALLELLG